MYFLDHDDQRLLVSRLGRQAREQPVAEDLRGWRWRRPPLSPVFEAPLSVEEAAGAVCPTGRDVYLKHVLGAPAPRTTDLVWESALRRLMEMAVVEGKRALYVDVTEAPAVIGALTPPPMGRLVHEEAPSPAGLARQVEVWWAWECRRVAARVADAMARRPGAGVDTLVAEALPVTVGRRLDGRFLGLAEQVEADGVVSPLPVVTVVRFGGPRPLESDRLVTAGLALVIESALECAVDFGCVTYGSVVGGQPAVRRDLFVVDDELRQRFIESRDERARLVQEEIDPGLPAECPEDCMFWSVCRGEAR